MIKKRRSKENDDLNSIASISTEGDADAAGQTEKGWKKMATDLVPVFLPFFLNRLSNLLLITLFLAHSPLSSVCCRQCFNWVLLLKRRLHTTNSFNNLVFYLGQKLSLYEAKYFGPNFVPNFLLHRGRISGPNMIPNRKRNLMCRRLFTNSWRLSMGTSLKRLDSHPKDD